VLGGGNGGEQDEGGETDSGHAGFSGAAIHRPADAWMHTKPRPDG